ncbi:uncharacterized protein LOC131523420 isoform X2 [Onychostoma macrolepis]|uniref:uncharacterized protein LOC131523420 isoform X2 n=1 Tax=Onychostoma macrolepis TaxID=369639 RepID=UPI00272D0693|nr:uncharacterized protein LOC131523420 isoform X2 [Onychostoma macrolepis]
MEELINSRSDAVGRLAFKYMMCKVDSSSDSEPESNPRCSDVSSKFNRMMSCQGCESGTSEAAERLRRCSGQNYLQCLDPYDGSSEDSGSSAKGSRKQRPGGFRAKGTGRRLTFNPASALRDGRRGEPRADVQMRSSSDSEQDSPHRGFWSPCVKADLSDSGFHTRSSLSSPAVPGPGAQSPALHAAFSKRKFFPPSDEGMQRKRKCVSDMELESVAL